jgi:hypothetical protein
MSQSQTCRIGAYSPQRLPLPLTLPLSRFVFDIFFARGSKIRGRRHRDEH